VTTATLIQVGSSDPRCLPENARTLHRALKQFGQADTELQIFSNEGHRLRDYNHLKAKMEWDLAWFNKYLLGSKDPLPERIDPAAR